MDTRSARRAGSLCKLLSVASVLVTPVWTHAQDNETSLLPYRQDPYPSTYQPLTSQPTAIVNTTILDGAGNQIENGTVLMEQGTISAIGTDVLVPDDVRVFDGAGKWVTPGIIDSFRYPERVSTQA